MPESFLYLTTIGWKTGQPHEIEIWYVAYDSRFYLVAETREHAHWVQNLRRNPAVAWHVDGRHYRGAARPIDRAAEPELAAAVAALMETKYDWSDGLIVELTPEPE